MYKLNHVLKRIQAYTGKYIIVCLCFALVLYTNMFIKISDFVEQFADDDYLKTQSRS